MTATVPVAIRVAPERRDRVARVVEGGLGWPVVELDDHVLPPAALITDVVSLGPAGPSGDRRRPVPVLLLVAGDDDPRASADAARVADTVLPWPPAPDDVRVAVAGATPQRLSRPWCTVVAAGGGVGATTVALALAGLRAWREGPTLAAVAGPAHVEGTPVLAPGDLASPAVWTAAASVPGLDGLRVVRLAAQHRDGTVDRHGTVAASGDVPVVVDLGVVDEPDALPDVLVVRADRTGLQAATGTTARWVVVVGSGDVSGHELATAVGRHRLIAVRVDPRVRRACHARRHPTDAPGTWLRPLDTIVTALAGTS